MTKGFYTVEVNIHIVDIVSPPTDVCWCELNPTGNFIPLYDSNFEGTFAYLKNLGNSDSGFNRFALHLEHEGELYSFAYRFKKGEKKLQWAKFHRTFWSLKRGDIVELWVRKSQKYDSVDVGCIINGKRIEWDKY